MLLEHAQIVHICTQLHTLLDRSSGQTAEWDFAGKAMESQTMLLLLKALA